MYEEELPVTRGRGDKFLGGRVESGVVARGRGDKFLGGRAGGGEVGRLSGVEAFPRACEGGGMASGVEPCPRSRGGSEERKG